MPILAEETCLYPDSLLDDSPRQSGQDWRSGDQAEPDADRQWWLIYTKSRQEKSLARQLLSMGIPFYLPLVRKDSMIRGRRVQSHLPLFGGYLFLFADDSQRVDCLATNRVSQLHHVGDPEQLHRDLCQINWLIRSDAPLTLERRLSAGQRVRVRTGAFKGISGTLIARRGDTRLLVAVDFIGQGVSMEIDDFQLEAE